MVLGNRGRHREEGMTSGFVSANERRWRGDIGRIGEIATVRIDR